MQPSLRLKFDSYPEHTKRYALRKCCYMIINLELELADICKTGKVPDISANYRMVQFSR
jgi:hypothetical protein